MRPMIKSYVGLMMRALKPYSQRKMFSIFEALVKLGGILAFTSGEKEREVWSDTLSCFFIDK